MATTTKPSAELTLDDAASTRFVRFFADVVASDGGADETTNETRTNGRRVVRFFDRKDFMSAHGDDATYIARTFYKVRFDSIRGVIGWWWWFRGVKAAAVGGFVTSFGSVYLNFLLSVARRARRWMKGCGDEGRRATDERMYSVVL